VTRATASSTKSPCSPASTRSTTSATAILWPSAIVALPSSISGRTDESGARGGRMSGSSWNFGGDPHG
jgi:hypothetical protein